MLFRLSGDYRVARIKSIIRGLFVETDSIRQFKGKALLHHFWMEHISFFLTVIVWPKNAYWVQAEFVGNNSDWKRLRIRDTFRYYRIEFWWQCYFGDKLCLLQLKHREKAWYTGCAFITHKKALGNFHLWNASTETDALNDLLIKISGYLQKSFCWEIDQLPMRF